jgi:putative hydrolase of the HAD superfamily
MDSVRVAFFDLGNTLLFDKDPWEALYRRADEALWRSLRASGVSASAAQIYGEHETLFDYYYALRQNDLDEPGIAPVLRGLLSRRNIVVPEAGLRAALRSMYAVTQANWYIEDDAVPTLETLKERGLRLGAISNGADDENTQTLINRTGIRPYFEFIISSAAFGKRKPHPGIFRVALDHLQAPPEQTVMVGDTYEADIVGAHDMGMHSIWVTRRVRKSPARMEVRPDAVVARLGEIPALLPA